MKIVSILAFSLVSCQSGSTLPMVTVPLYQSSFKAHYLASTSFSSGQPDIADFSGTPLASVILANISFNTFRPFVILSNFVEVTEVACQEVEQIGDIDFPTLIGPDLFITFNNETNAMDAFEEWSNISNLVMYVCKEWQCNRRNRALLVGVSGMYLDGSILGMNFYNVGWSDVVKDYSLNVSKRIVDIPLPMDINYDPLTKSVVQPQIQLSKSKYTDTACLNCHLQGGVEFLLEINGTSFSISHYTMSVTGEFVASVDVQTKVKANWQPEKIIESTIQELQLTAFGVPGLLSIGPVVRLRLAHNYSISSAGDFDATTGFEVRFPVNLQIISVGGLMAMPSFHTQSAPPNATVHIPKFSGDYIGSFESTYTVVPEIGISLKLFTIDHSVGMSFQNTLGVAATVGETKCLSDNATFFHQGAFTFAVHSGASDYQWKLWESDRRNLLCLSCDQCPAKTLA